MLVTASIARPPTRSRALRSACETVEPRQDIASAVDLEISRTQRDDPVEHGAADIGDDALADPGDELIAATRRTGEQDDNADKDKNSAVERRRVAALEAVIDEPAQPLTKP